MLTILKFNNGLFYGWVIVLIFFITAATLQGIQNSFGIFFKSIENEFLLTRAATSAIFSANLFLAGLFAFIGGWALDKYGPRIVIFLMGLFTGLGLLTSSQTNAPWQLFITYSLLIAMGTGSLYVVQNSTISRWFDRNRGLALGISGSGIGLGAVVMAPFATYLISAFDWRVAYIVIALLVWFTVVPLSVLLKRDPYEIGALPDGARLGSINLKNDDDSIQPKGLSLTQALRTRSFWLFIFEMIFYASSLFLIFTHLVPHITDVGISATEAATVLSLMGGVAIAGRLIMGTISDKMSRKVSALICTSLQAIATMWLIWANSLLAFYLFAIIFGFSYGGAAPTTAALVGDTFGLRRIGGIMGMLGISHGIGAAIGPALGGIIYDVNNSYFLAFILGASVLIMATISIALIRPEMDRCK